MNRLHNTIKGSPRVADGEFPLHDRKTRAELKDMKWNRDRGINCTYSA